MTYIRTVSDEEAEGAVARAYEESRRTSGGIYATDRLLSLWPDVLAMEKGRYQTVMLAPSALTRAEKEMIATAVSAANRCGYCVHHHKASMLEAGVDPRVAQAIAEDYTAAGFDERTRAMLDFVLTERPDLSAQVNIDRLRELGFDDRQILEMIVVAGFFHDYNLRVSIFGLELED